MNRRSVLAATSSGLAAGVAGCTADEDESEPEPAESELRLHVENDHEAAQSLLFVLQITHDRETVTEVFESGEIEPGETWTHDSGTLSPGEYELTVQLPDLEMETETAWVGHECPVKTIELELRDDGFRMRSDCPDE